MKLNFGSIKPFRYKPNLFASFLFYLLVLLALLVSNSAEQDTETIKTTPGLQTVKISSNDVGSTTILDEDIDPEDVIEYDKKLKATTKASTVENDKTPTEQTIDTTSKVELSSTTESSKVTSETESTTTSIENKKTQSVNDIEINDQDKLLPVKNEFSDSDNHITEKKTTRFDNEETEESSAKNSDSSEQEELVLTPKINSDNLNIIELIQYSYQTVKIDRSKSKNDISLYMIRSFDESYQIEVNFEIQSPLDFRSCPIAFNETDCIKSYIEIIKPNTIIKINKSILPQNIKLRFRLVISGCNPANRIRDIELLANLPIIYHNQDQDCIYRIKNMESKKSMVSVIVNQFPSSYVTSCKTSIQIFSSDKNETVLENTYKQANIDSINSLIPFAQGVFVARKFIYIKLVNCYETTEPIEIRINTIKKTSYKETLTEKGKWSYGLDSFMLLSPKYQDSALLFELINEDKRNIITGRLTQYDAKKDDCVNLNSNSSLITIYGFSSASNEMFVKQYWPCDQQPTELLEFRGYERLFVQFYREPFHPQSRPKVDDFRFDFNLTPVKKLYKKISKRSAKVSSLDLENSDLRNQYIDFEIETTPGSRILFKLESFDNGKNIENICKKMNDDDDLMDCIEKCDDFIIIKLNKTLSRNGLIVEEEPNPKFCNLIKKPIVISSYTNKLLVTINFKELKQGQVALKAPSFEFSYTSEPICNNQYKNQFAEYISYNSLQSVIFEDECVNSIRLHQYRRIILYKINWSSVGQNKYSAYYDDESTNGFINGKLVCKNSDSLIISNQNPKYSKFALTNNPFENYNTYCIDNPFSSLVSNGNQLFLNFKRMNETAKSKVPSKPLSFDIGYFSYRYFYSDHDEKVAIDFSKIIPQSLNNKTKQDIEFKIKLSDTNNYLVPVISQCNTQLKHGEVNIRTSLHNIPFEMICGEKTFTLLSSMENEIAIQFKNVFLSELRDNAIRFNLSYKTLPKLLTALNGKFESNDFTHNYLSSARENIEYEWTIDLHPNYFLRLKIEELTNPENIMELSIYDGVRNINLYEQTELIEQFKAKQGFLSYLFPTNKLRIRFSHLKEPKTKTTKYPYVKFSYIAEPRILNLNLQSISGIINYKKSMTKDKLEWLLMAPKDNIILLYVISYSTQSKTSNGQLKFSLLNNGYSDNGTYYLDINDHRNLFKQGEINRNTDIVVSKDNFMRIEYSPGDIDDSFKLAYTFTKKIYKNPSGMIKQYENDFTLPKIHVPKLTDQTWKIKAPFGKRIQIFTRFIDLLGDDPCSKATINFYDTNGTLIDSTCGHLDIEPATFDLENHLLLTSQSDELTIRFQTQNTDEVIFRSKPASLSGYELYRGFIFYYTILESAGDCYFQIRKNILCNYKNYGEDKIGWLISEEELTIIDIEQKNFDNIFCSNCHLKATIPLQENENELIIGERINPTLVSPIIKKNKRFLKFSYKLLTGSQLKVKLIYEREFAKSIDRSILLKTLDQQKDNWSTIRIKIGNQLFHNYRIIFILEKSENYNGIVQPTASLDNIQLFEQDIDCSSIMDGSCDYIEFVNNVPSLRMTEERFDFDKKTCQRYLTPCDVNECSNGALCLNRDELVYDNKTAINNKINEDGYVCMCRHGFTGKHCEIEIDPCSSNQFNKCSNNSKCISFINSTNHLSKMNYECKCDKHYYGKYCEFRYTPCKNTKLYSNPCHQLDDQGICEDIASEESPNEYKCNCSPMYTGKNCEIKLTDSCLNSKCNQEDKNATCVELNNKFVCMCSAGFEGASCKNIDDCASSPCQNNGKCIDGINSFQCQCKEGFVGKYCENIKACQQCNSNGTLYCDKKEAKCICKLTHAGSLCESPLDPCLDNPCANGKCFSNKIDEYECFCDKGYKGKKCDTKENICDKGVCKNGASCTPIIDLNGSIDYNCKCAEGYEGRNCEKLIDMCSLKLSPCKNGATCFNLIKNYTCVCPDGYHGKNCEHKKDYCLSHKCSHGSTCINMQNGYLCKCLPGKLGRYCNEENDRCFNNECENGICVPDQSESLNYNSRKYKCDCMNGFTGMNCEKKINYCEMNPCQNDAKCVDLIGSYKCVCKDGFKDKNCQTKINFCSSIDTQCNATNTARCVPFKGGNRCVCLPGFTGAKCENPINVCDYLKPCRSGKCVAKGDNSYECLNCTSGFGGKNCSEMINYCESNPCKNDGKCYATFQGSSPYHCQCKPGFSGINCEIPISQACIYNRCKHNSKCVETKNGYRCECDNNYEGTYCEKKIDKCRNVNCKPGAFCKDGVCECDPKSVLCKGESACNKMSCENGGVCKVVIISETKTIAQCVCPPGLTGEKCELSIYCSNQAIVQPCGDMRQCKTVNQSYQCECERNKGNPYRSSIGHGCNKSFSDYEPGLNNYLAQERLIKEKQNCRFGNSKESRIFIGIVAVGVLIFIIIGFLIGHCAVVSIRKKYEFHSKINIKTNYSVMTDEDSTSRSMNSTNPKTPTNPKLTEITLNKLNGFSIPRPSVRL